MLSSKDSEIQGILRNEDDFMVLTREGLRNVKSHDISESLKRISDERLTDFLNNGEAVIKADQFSNGDFKLDMHVREHGGGAVGAAVGVVAGTALVQGVAHGTIWTLAALTGPFVFYVGYGLEAAAAPAIHSATIYAAAVGGMTGAALTGPIR